VGYQAKGTPGRDIIKYSIKKSHGYLQIDGEKIKIKAKIHTLTGYSAHANQKGLLDWVNAISDKPKKIKRVHGEYKARKALEELLGNNGHNVVDCL